MIKVGKMLIDPNDISSVHQDSKTLDPYNNKTRGLHIIQIIFKNGVVKNFTSQEIGLSYDSFVEELMKESNRAEDNRILRTLAAIKSLNNE